MYLLIRAARAAIMLSIAAVVLFGCSANVSVAPTPKPTTLPTLAPTVAPTNTDVPVAIPTATETTMPTLETEQGMPVSEASPRIIAAYFGIFDGAYDAAMDAADDIPWNKINRLYIAFATVQDGELTDMTLNDTDDTAHERIARIVELYRAANPDGEIFISSSYGDELDAQYRQAATDPQRFAQSVVDYLQANDLDGYDMDWESRAINAYADDLKNLLDATHDALQSAGPNARGKAFQLTHTIWPGVHSTETVARLADIVDQINLMTYGDGSMDDVQEAAQEYGDAGFPREKMIVGVESEYGYPSNGGVETQETIARKGAFVRDHNMAGMFTWRLDNDMRIASDGTEGGPPTFRVAGWVYDEMAQ